MKGVCSHLDSQSSLEALSEWNESKGSVLRKTENRERKTDDSKKEKGEEAGRSEAVDESTICDLRSSK